MNVSQTVDAWRAGALSASAFRRALASWDSWEVSRQGKSMGLRALLAGGVTGEDAFAAVDAGVDRVSIDAGAGRVVEIGKDEFEDYREIAAAVRVERCWQRIREATEREGDVSRVAAFEAYHVAAVKEPEGVVLIHVPHDDGRMFAPFFTHRDALELALEDFQRTFPRDSISCTIAAGPRLLPAIAKEKAEGLVINYLGPSKPVAFKLDVLPLILESLEQQT